MTGSQVIAEKSGFSMGVYLPWDGLSSLNSEKSQISGHFKYDVCDQITKYCDN